MCAFHLNGLKLVFPPAPVDAEGRKLLFFTLAYSAAAGGEHDLCPFLFF